MLNKNEEIMLAKIKAILDEVSTDYAKLYGKKRKTDGSVALYVEYGTSGSRLSEPNIRIEIISYTLAQDPREKLFIFESIEAAYIQIEQWYEARKKELASLFSEDRTTIAEKINGRKGKAPSNKVVDELEY
jgi:hypothetical protein